VSRLRDCNRRCFPFQRENAGGALGSFIVPEEDAVTNAQGQKHSCRRGSLTGSLLFRQSRSESVFIKVGNTKYITVARVLVTVAVRTIISNRNVLGTIDSFGNVNFLDHPKVYVAHASTLVGFYGKSQQNREISRSSILARTSCFLDRYYDLSRWMT
jgi:hypothetical protein